MEGEKGNRWENPRHRLRGTEERLLVHALAHLLQALQDGGAVLPLEHVLLEAVHTGLGHFGRRVAVIELAQGIGVG